MGAWRRRPAVLVALIAVDLVSCVLAWRDLRDRSEDEVRGGKRLWHVVIVANPGNSLAYWLIGRKKSQRPERTLRIVGS